MNYHSIIDHFSKSIVKKSQISSNFNSIIFEPKGDGKSFNMLCFVPSLNENVQFGVLSVDKNFMNFLKSGLAPNTAFDADKAFWYFKEGILTISDRVPQRVYEQISQNLKLCMGGDKQKINNFIMTGLNNLELPVSPDLHHRMRNKEINDVISAYQKYLVQSIGRSSEAVPHLAKIKSISYRDRQEK